MSIGQVNGHFVADFLEFHWDAGRGDDDWPRVRRTGAGGTIGRLLRGKPWVAPTLGPLLSAGPYDRVEPGQFRGVTFNVTGQFLVEPGSVVGGDVFLERGFIPVDLEDEVFPGILFAGAGKKQFVAWFLPDVLGQFDHHFGNAGLTAGFDGELGIQGFGHDLSSGWFCRGEVL